jgi:hypothetical protein
LVENRWIITDIVGMWWEDGWVGMYTKPINLPVVIPPHMKAIIQINHIIRGNITIHSSKLDNIQHSALEFIFKKVNPTKYIVQVKNASVPFFLIFSESYNSQWKVYAEDGMNMELKEIIAEYPNVNVKEARHDWFKFTPQDIAYLFKKTAVNETYHFMANGYANAWYIDPKEIDKDGDGCFTITLYYLPQSVFYLGLIISSLTFIVCIGYLLYCWK